MESWRKILYLSWGILFFQGIGMSMFAPFLPLYVKELGIADLQAQSIWSGILIGAAPLLAGFLAPLWGTISDKYGRKPLILRTTLGVSIVALLMYFSTNVYQLLVLRIVQGICGGMMPAFTALVAFNLPKDKIGQGIGALQSAMYSGGIVGPFIGGLLSDLMGFRNVLLVISSTTFIAGIVTALFINEPKRVEGKVRGTVVNNIRLVFLSPNLRTVAITIFFVHFSLVFIQPILPLFIVSLHSTANSATMVGLIFTVTGFATVLFSPYWGKAGDRRGHENILSQNLLFASIACFPQALVTSSYQLLPLRAIVGFFFAGILSSTQTMIVKNTQDSERGGVLGITYSVYSFGNAIGPLLGGVVGALCGYRFPFMLMSALSFAIWYFFRKSMNPI